MVVALRVLLTLILAIVLTACGAGDAPKQTVVQKAIAVQFGQIQQNLGQQIYRTEAGLPTFVIDHVKVQEQKPLLIQDLKAYQVRGTYDLTLQFPDHKLTQHQNAFEVYLQQQPDDETWRLARPQADQQWVTSLIPEDNG
jgi:hypothetical protein